jgi:hypothetical protein
MSTEMNYPQWYLHGVENGWIRSNIRELVRFLAEEYGELNNSELLVTVFTSLFQEAGHVTLPLYKSPAEWGTILGLEEESIKRLQSSVLPETSELFLKSKITGNPGETVPYILEVRGGKEFISINRFRRYEERIAEWITEKSSEVTVPAVPIRGPWLAKQPVPGCNGYRLAENRCRAFALQIISDCFGRTGNRKNHDGGAHSGPAPKDS